MNEKENDQCINPNAAKFRQKPFLQEGRVSACALQYAIKRVVNKVGISFIKIDKLS